MRKRIYFSYHHVEMPWGGANNFMRTLHNAIAESEYFDILEAPSRECDILFMNQLGRGPAAGSGRYSIKDVKNMLGANTRLIVRAINLRHHNPGYTFRTFFENKMRDIKTMHLLHMADHVIFQSNYQKDMFIDHGFKGTSWSVIHNGAARDFYPAESPPPLDGPLRVLSCAIGGRSSKLHPLMAAMSQLADVEMHYAGKWPADVPSAQIHQHGVIPACDIAALLKTMHYLFHPATKDICPNVVCEALASGVPVIYNPGPGGAPEMAASTGIALQEDDIASTTHEARQRYKTSARDTRILSSYYRTDRVTQEYIKTILQ